MNVAAGRVLLAACCLAVAACSQSDTNKATQQANKAVEGVNKAAQSIATSAPVLAARDALLATAVKARLTIADIDSATSVGVTARDGAVTLGGAVRTTREIATLRDAARSVTGVKAVRADLRVDPHVPSAGTSAANVALAARVTAAIAAQAGLNALSVRASARNGVVSLEGTLHSAALKAIVLDAAKRTSGVRSVVDHIKLSP